MESANAQTSTISNKVTVFCVMRRASAKSVLLPVSVLLVTKSITGRRVLLMELAYAKITSLMPRELVLCVIH